MVGWEIAAGLVLAVAVFLCGVLVGRKNAAKINQGVQLADNVKKAL